MEILLLTMKNKPKKRRAPFDRITWLDGLHERCDNVETLAGLLEICAEPVAPELAQHTGHLIAREMAALRTLLEKEAR